MTIVQPNYNTLYGLLAETINFFEWSNDDYNHYYRTYTQFVDASSALNDMFGEFN
jgi:hypothetical protein